MISTPTSGPSRAYEPVGQDAFVVIREAMKRKNMVGLGKVVISRRERIVMLKPFDKGLMATTLRYAYEVRDTKPYFEDIPSLKLPDEMDSRAHSGDQDGTF